MALLETRLLTLYAGNKLLCEQLNWQCAPGEIWAVLGRNGAGKTTLLHSLAGIRACAAPRCQGEIYLHDQALTSWSRKHIAQRLGLLMQDYHEPFPGTVMEYVLMGRHPYLHALQWESEQDFARAHAALQWVGLEDFVERDIQSLSGGEFQRMRIAMLLVQDPQILLLDEPVNHLDLQFQHVILKAIVNTVSQTEKSIVMSIHDVNLALRYCSHALLMHEMGQVESGEIGQVLNEQSLSALYQHPVKAITTAGGSLFVAD